MDQRGLLLRSLPTRNPYDAFPHPHLARGSLLVGWDNENHGGQMAEAEMIAMMSFCAEPLQSVLNEGRLDSWKRRPTACKT